MFRAITRRQLLIDLLIAFAVVVPLVLFDFVLMFNTMASWVALVWKPMLGALLVALLTLRRWAPVPMLGGALVLSAVHVLVLGQYMEATWFAVLVLLATVGRFAEQRLEWWASGGIIFVASILVSVAFVRLLLGLDPAIGGSFQLGQALMVALFTFIPSLLLFVGAVLAGVVLRLIVRANLEARERQRAEAVSLAEMQLRAAEEERTAIARDMHDIVAHSLAVVVAQANGARYTQEIAKKDESLATIAATAKSALVDVRGLLHQLRHSQAAQASTGIDDIPGLVAQMQAAGMDARLELPGDTEKLGRTTQLAAYRIVQEALTNAMRHGLEGAPVHVRIVQDFGRCKIDIHNRPRTYGGADTGGHGLTGMRERASLAGGSAWIGLDGGWFRVSVDLPKEVQL